MAHQIALALLLAAACKPAAKSAVPSQETAEAKKAPAQTCGEAIDATTGLPFATVIEFSPYGVPHEPVATKTETGSFCIELDEGPHWINVRRPNDANPVGAVTVAYLGPGTRATLRVPKAPNDLEIAITEASERVRGIGLAWRGSQAEVEALLRSTNDEHVRLAGELALLVRDGGDGHEHRGLADRILREVDTREPLLTLWPDALVRAARISSDPDVHHTLLARVMIEHPSEVVRHTINRAMRDVAGAGSGLQVGDAVPSFMLGSIDGKELVRSTALVGKPGIIYVWATWCRPCHVFMPKLRELASAHPGVGILTISTDESAEVARSWDKSHGPIPGLRAISTPDHRAELVKVIGSLTMPTLLVTDERGKVVAVLRGTDEIRKGLKDALARAGAAESIGRPESVR